LASDDFDFVDHFQEETSGRCRELVKEENQITMNGDSEYFLGEDGIPVQAQQFFSAQPGLLFLFLNLGGSIGGENAKWECQLYSVPIQQTARKSPFAQLAVLC